MLNYLVDYVRFNVLKNEEGQGLVEYALIIVLIAIVAMVALDPVGEQIKTIFNNIKTGLTNASS